MPKPGKYTYTSFTYRSGRRPSGSLAKPSGKLADMYFELDEVNYSELIKALRYLETEIPNPRTKRRILNKAAEPVQDAARRLTPIWDGTDRDGRYGLKTNVHYRYKSGARKTGTKAGKGKGVIVGSYKAGHLEQSVQVLSATQLKRARIGVIGPRRNGPGPKYGFSRAKNSKNVDAYYAHMIYGNARAFRTRIMEPALQQAGPQAARIIEDEVLKILSKF